MTQTTAQSFNEDPSTDKSLGYIATQEEIG